jgi:CPA1 family monovalent cation:H+ antiporter
MNSVFIVVGGAATGYILTLVLTHLLHISGPLAMVVAGLIIGNKIHIDVTCDNIQKTVADFWLMIDEILNAIVFFMMGLILHLLEFDWHRVLLGIIAIIVVLIARYFGILIPFSFLGSLAEKRNKASLILTWGGLRGGISIALALGVGKMHHGSLLLLITFFVVFFSIVVQGLTVEKIYKKMFEQ